MKPIHFKPVSDDSERENRLRDAYRSEKGAGVAAVVRSATATERSQIAEHQRRVQLDDYVARIRQTAGDVCQPSQPEVIFRTNDHDEKKGSSSLPTNSSIQSPTEVDPKAETTPDAYLFRTDTQHTPEGSQVNRETIQQFNDALHKLRAPHVSSDKFSSDGYETEKQRLLDAAQQRQIIDEISVAIASTLTEATDEKLKAKLPQSETTDQPNEPNPEQHADDGTSELPVEVAAWDVEDFRWPTLSNQMIATASDAMQQLFDQVLSISDQDDARPSNRLAVTGAGRGEGTSTIAISVARWAAACGKSVLLIDADINNPKLTTQVGLQHGLSWLKAILRSENPAEVIIRSQRSNLCVMPMAPLGARSDYPRCLFDSLGPFLGKVESYFDWVIMDFGPGSQLLAELSRPELLIDSALLIGSNANPSGLSSLQNRLHSLGVERFVLAENSVRQQDAA